MKVRVRLFAVARQLAGADEVELSVRDRCTVDELRQALAAQVPALAPVLPHVLLAINADYAPGTAVIHADSEVACIPPVSGG